MKMTHQKKMKTLSRWFTRALSSIKLRTESKRKTLLKPVQRSRTPNSNRTQEESRRAQKSRTQTLPQGN
jgi:hypothetical protein